jgi:DUF4097 and DUF4098 domain-containing protein YvlB
MMLKIPPTVVFGMALGLMLGACRSMDTSFAQQNERFSRQYPAGDVTSLRVASSSGDVIIRGGDNEQASVVASTTGDCKVEATLRHGEIGVVLHDKQFWSRCRGTLNIEVPHKLAVDAASGSGNLTIADISGSLSLRTGSGDVRASGEIAQLVVKTGSGDVQLTGLHGPAIVTAGSGNVSLTYAVLPEGALRIEQGAGDVRIVVPHGPVLTQVQAGSGKIDNQAGTDPGARFAVRGSIGAGDLHILLPSSGV